MRGVVFLKNFFFPPLCRNCKAVDLSGSILCSQCMQKLSTYTEDQCLIQPQNNSDSPLYEVLSLAPVSEVSLTLVHGLKYETLIRDIKILFQKTDLASLALWLEKSDVLVPVPLHRARRIERGYNQSEAIIAELKKHCGLMVLNKTLRRNRHSQSQTKMTRQERADNTKDLFSIPKPENVIGKKVVLVDDVYTTGATTNACAEVLLKAGAESVRIFTLLRAEKNNGAYDFETDLYLARLKGEVYFNP
jgi:ComF family protein